MHHWQRLVWFGIDGQIAWFAFAVVIGRHWFGLALMVKLSLNLAYASLADVDRQLPVV